MLRSEWKDIFVTHVVDNSDATREEAEEMADEEANSQCEEHGKDASTWDHPHDAALQMMRGWEGQEGP